MANTRPTISSLDDVRQFFAENPINLISFGDVPFFIAGIESASLPVTFISNVPDGSVQSDTAPNMRFIRFQKRTKPPARPGLNEALADREVRREVESCSVQPRLLLFRHDYETERIVQENGWTLLSNPRVCLDAIEDKCTFPTLLLEAGLRPLPGGSVAVESVQDWRIYLDRYPTGFVVQLPDNTLNGRGTFFVRTASDAVGLRSALEGGARWVRVAPLLNGVSINTSACVTRHGIAQSRAYRQMVGLPDLTTVRGGHCGNDGGGAAPVDSATEQQAYKFTDAIGQVLLRRGYKGLFGIDFVLDEDGYPWPIEVNARMQSCTSLITATQVRAGLPPLVALHILEHLDAGYAIDVAEYNAQNVALAERHCAQVVMFYLGDAGRVLSSLRVGRYSLAEPGRYIGPGTSLCDVSQDELLLTRVLDRGQILTAHMMMYILQFWQCVADEHNQLFPWASRLSQDIRKQCKVEDLNDI